MGKLDTEMATLAIDTMCCTMCSCTASSVEARRFFWVKAIYNYIYIYLQHFTNQCFKQ